MDAEYDRFITDRVFGDVVSPVPELPAGDGTEPPPLTPRHANDVRAALAWTIGQLTDTEADILLWLGRHFMRGRGNKLPEAEIMRGKIRRGQLVGARRRKRERKKS